MRGVSARPNSSCSLTDDGDRAVVVGSRSASRVRWAPSAIGRDGVELWRGPRRQIIRQGDIADPARRGRCACQSARQHRRRRRRMSAGEAAAPLCRRARARATPLPACGRRTSSAGATGCSRRISASYQARSTRLHRSRAPDRSRDAARCASARATPPRSAMAMRMIACVVAEARPAVTSRATSHSPSCTPLSRPTMAPWPVARVTRSVLAPARDAIGIAGEECAPQVRLVDVRPVAPSPNSARASLCEALARPPNVWRHPRPAIQHGQQVARGRRRARPSNGAGSDSSVAARAAFERAARGNHHARQPRMQRQAAACAGQAACRMSRPHHGAEPFEQRQRGRDAIVGAVARTTRTTPGSAPHDEDGEQRPG